MSTRNRRNRRKRIRKSIRQKGGNVNNITQLLQQILIKLDEKGEIIQVSSKNDVIGKISSCFYEIFEKQHDKADYPIKMDRMGGNTNNITQFLQQISLKLIDRDIKNGKLTNVELAKINKNAMVIIRTFFYEIFEKQLDKDDYPIEMDRMGGNTNNITQLLQQILIKLDEKINKNLSNIDAMVKIRSCFYEIFDNQNDKVKYPYFTPTRPRDLF